MNEYHDLSFDLFFLSISNVRIGSIILSFNTSHKNIVFLSMLFCSLLHVLCNFVVKIFCFSN